MIRPIAADKSIFGLFGRANRRGVSHFSILNAERSKRPSPVIIKAKLRIEKTGPNGVVQLFSGYDGVISEAFSLNPSLRGATTASV